MANVVRWDPVREMVGMRDLFCFPVRLLWIKPRLSLRMEC